MLAYQGVPSLIGDNGVQEDGAVGDGGYTVAHTGQVKGDGLDLLQLDPVATDLDLAVAPSEEHDFAIATIHGPVTRTIEPLARSRMVDKRIRCFFRIVPVAQCQPPTSDIQVSGDETRTVFKGRVEDVHLLIRQWPAVRYARQYGVRGADLVPVGPDRCLRRSAQPIGSTALEGLCDAQRDVDRDPVTAQEHRSGVFIDKCSVLEMAGIHREERWYGVPQRDAM